MKNAKKLLELVRTSFQSPRPGQRHCFTLEGDTLVLTLMLGDTYQQLNLDENDLGKDPDELLAEIIEVMKSAPVDPGTDPIKLVSDLTPVA